MTNEERELYDFINNLEEILQNLDNKEEKYVYTYSTNSTKYYDDEASYDVDRYLKRRFVCA